MTATRLTVAETIAAVTRGDLPFRITAFDSSEVGPPDAEMTLHISSDEGLRYVLSAPGDLGLARAYVSGSLKTIGVPPGDPHDLLADLRRVRLHRPAPRQVREIARSLGLRNFLPPQPPPQEAPARWRRAVRSLHSGKARAAEAISHHYDVGNDFYERILGPSMTYTCAVFTTPDDTLEAAQEAKYALIADKLNLRPGQRLLDVGCGWGGMVRFAAREYGVKAIGATLSRQQATWAQQAVREEGLDKLVEVRNLDYRDVAETGFDAISSIGLTEHLGVRNYPAYFGFLRSRLAPGGRLLNHCITRPDNRASHRTDPFTDRYVFPDGELASIGLIVSQIHDAGLEVQHVENLRQHYALTLQRWGANLVDRWDECVDLVGAPTAKVWGLYMAGSRLAFETNTLQLHQVLATADDGAGPAAFPLRPDWSD